MIPDVFGVTSPPLTEVCFLSSRYKVQLRHLIFPAALKDWRTSFNNDGFLYFCNSRNPEWHNALSSSVKMRVPHSNAFIDLNRDFTAGESPVWAVFNQEKRQLVSKGFCAYNEAFFLFPESSVFAVLVCFHSWGFNWSLGPFIIRISFNGQVWVHIQRIWL